MLGMGTRPGKGEAMTPRTFMLVEAFAETIITIDDHHVTERTASARPDAPGVATGTREYDIKPGLVAAYIDECLLARGFHEPTEIVEIIERPGGYAWVLVDVANRDSARAIASAYGRIEEADETDDGRWSFVVSSVPENDDQAEQERRWRALDASVPCAHFIPGSCDYC